MALRLRRTACAGACLLPLLVPAFASASNAPIVTVAGNGTFAAFPAPTDGSGSFAATSTPFKSAAGISTLLANFGDSFFFGDPQDNRVLQVSGSAISVLAGTGSQGTTGDGGLPTDARLNGPQAVGEFEVGWAIADSNNRCIRIIKGAGVGSPTISTDSGHCDPSVATIADGTPPTSGSYGAPVDIEIWAGSSEFTEVDYYVADASYVRQVSGSGGTRSLTTVAGSSSGFTPPDDNTAPTSGYLGSVQDVAVTGTSSTYFIAGSDSLHDVNRVFKVTGGKIFTVAGLGTGTGADGDPAAAAPLSNPTGVLALADGGVLIYDAGHEQIRRVSSGSIASATISTVAGNGTEGSSPDGTAADAASLRSNGRLALISSGLLFTQSSNSTGGLVRKIPATAIVSGPAGFVSSTSASFGLASWDQNATYECRLDGGSFGVCGSYSSLAQGQHAFQVRATTNNGTLLDSTGATRTWTVDTAQPAPFALTAPGNAAFVTTGQPTITWDATSDAGGLDRYDVMIDDQVAGQVSGSCSSCSFQPSSPLGEGPHMVRINAVDKAGNFTPTETHSFTVDTVVPAPFTLAGPDDGAFVADASPAIAWNESSDATSGIDRYDVVVDGDVVAQLSGCPAGACSAQPGAPLGEGAHTFHVEAFDKAGNMTATGARAFTVDTVPPAVFDVDGPVEGATLADARPTITWAAPADATSGIDAQVVTIDGFTSGAPAGCTSCSLQSERVLGDGDHTVTVDAVDKAGNHRVTATRHFSVVIPPVAALSIGPARALVGRQVVFDGSASHDDNGSLTRFEWDLDGDGSFETDTGTGSTVTRTYDKPQTITARLRVTDEGGRTAEASGILVVTAVPPASRELGVSIDDGAQYTNDPHVTVFAVWPSFASDMLVSNDGGFKLPQTFPVAEQVPWTLDSSGPERLPKTVYVRFRGGIQTSETFTDDIILDQTPPTVVAATLAAPASSARVAKAARVTLKVKATDNVSGVGAMQVTANKRKPGKVLKFRKALRVKAGPRLYVRVRDRAGNFSSWRKAAKR